MFAIQVAGDEGAEFDGVGDEQEQPVEQDDAIGIARPPMLRVLDEEDDAEGDEGEDGGPETKVAGPYALVVSNLEGGLGCGGGNKGGDCCLQRHNRSAYFLFPDKSETPYQLCVKMPILLDGLRHAFLIEVPGGGSAAEEAAQGDDGYPDIEEARREVISDRAYRAPSFAAATQRLALVARSLEVAVGGGLG